MCMCVVDMCACIHAGVLAYVGRCGGQRSVSIIISETRSLTEPGAYHFRWAEWLVSPQKPSVFPPEQGYKCAMLYAYLFDMVLWSQVWVFMLLQKTHHGALVPVLCHVFWYWDVTLPWTDRLDHVIASANCHFDSIQTHLGDRSLSMPVGSYLDCLHNVGRPALFTVWM